MRIGCERGPKPSTKNMKAIDARKAIQEILHVAEDGVMGEMTDNAYSLLDGLPDDAEWPAQAPENSDGVHRVNASSFADPADVRAFERCKNQGNSDKFCFGKGDNAVGKWGDSTAAGSGPIVALPPEDWQRFGSSARGKKVLVTANGKSVVAELRDTMPHKANVKNGAGIDLNPDCASALGLNPPFMVEATWAWA